MPAECTTRTPHSPDPEDTALPKPWPAARPGPEGTACADDLSALRSGPGRHTAACADGPAATDGRLPVPTASAGGALVTSSHEICSPH